MLILTLFVGATDVREEGSKLTTPEGYRCRHSWLSGPDPQDRKQLFPISAGAGASENVLTRMSHMGLPEGRVLLQGHWDYRRDTRLPCQLDREGEQQARSRERTGRPYRPRE